MATETRDFDAMKKAELREYVEAIADDVGLDISHTNRQTNREEWLRLAKEAAMLDDEAWADEDGLVADYGQEFAAMDELAEEANSSRVIVTDDFEGDSYPEPQQWTESELNALPEGKLFEVLNDWGRFVLGRDWELPQEPMEASAVIRTLQDMGAVKEETVAMAAAKKDLTKRVKGKKATKVEGEEGAVKGPRKRRYTDEQIREFFEMKLNGYSQTKIAKHFDCSGVFVSNVLRRNVYADVFVDDLLERINAAETAETD